MPKSSHTRNGVPRRHRNGVYGSTVNGKRIGLKVGALNRASKK